MKKIAIVFILILISTSIFSRDIELTSTGISIDFFQKYDDYIYSKNFEYSIFDDLCIDNILTKVVLVEGCQKEIIIKIINDSSLEYREIINGFPNIENLEYDEEGRVLKMYKNGDIRHAFLISEKIAIGYSYGNNSFCVYEIIF